MPAPSREGRGLDQFNDQLRATPEYRAFLQSIGVNPDAAIRLSGRQRSQAEGFVRQMHPDLAGKFQIDPAGNINTDHGLSTAWSNPYFRYPLLAGATIGTLGAAGVFSGAAGAAGAAGGAGTAAAGTGAGVGAGTAATVGTTAAATGAARFLNPGTLRLLELGTGLGTTYMGNRSQTNANREATEAQRIADERQAEIERRRDEESRRRWEAEQAHQANVFAATEEERLHRRRLEEEREARQAPYRAASAQALGRLGDLIGLNGQRGPAPWLSPSNVGRTPTAPGRP